MLSIVLGVIGIAVGVVGVRLTDLARREARQKSDFTWEEVSRGVRDLARRIEPDFEPTLIVSSSAGSVGVVANLYITETTRFIPLYLGVSRRNQPAIQFASYPIFTDRYTTDRWETFLPGNLRDSGAQKVLILEDAVISGDSMKRIREVLKGQGFVDEQIRTAALIVNQFAFETGHAPDYHWQIISQQVINFPWGKSSGKTF